MNKMFLHFHLQLATFFTRSDLCLNFLCFQVAEFSCCTRARQRSKLGHLMGFPTRSSGPENPGGPYQTGPPGTRTRHPQKLQTCTFEGSRRFKHHQNSTRRPPKREEKNEFCGGKGRKKREILAPPSLRAPNTSGPDRREKSQLHHSEDRNGAAPTRKTATLLVTLCHRDCQLSFSRVDRCGTRC